MHAEATLLIHTHVREDQLSLYGFLTAREKQCFELLISASGVGPSLALKILSGMSMEELVPAIRKGDLAQLVRIPGVGQKTAERIVVELRDKLAALTCREQGSRRRVRSSNRMWRRRWSTWATSRSVEKRLRNRAAPGARFRMAAARVAANLGGRRCKGSARGTGRMTAGYANR